MNVDLLLPQTFNGCGWWPDAPVLVRGDGGVQLLEKLLQEFLGGTFQREPATGVRKHQRPSPNLGLQVMADLASKAVYGDT